MNGNFTRTALRSIQFLVDLGTGNTNGPEAGFQEVSGIGMEVTVPSTATATTKRTA
jgi:hypothetical protein